MKSRSLDPTSALALGVSLLLGTAAPGRAADTYTVDNVHSSVLFRVKHFGAGYIYVRFNDLSGTFAFDDKDPAACSFHMQVKSASVDSNNPKRDAHLKSPDFFNAKEFPRISFKSTQVKLVDAQIYQVTGDLTLLGVTKPVQVRIERVGTTKTPQGYRTGIETTFTIKRSDFGMKFMPDALGDDVRVTVASEGVRK
jgi:polyisoprenoid-binding protein YceI